VKISIHYGLSDFFEVPTTHIAVTDIGSNLSTENYIRSLLSGCAIVLAVISVECVQEDFKLQVTITVEYESKYIFE
jgi:hypothetical protein